jgi:cyclic beta-1,2-glucan synthetase
MLSKLNYKGTASAQNQILNLELLKALKQDAVNLSAVDLMSLGSNMDDRNRENLLFWIESPLKHVERAIDEYKCLTLPDQLDINAYSPQELNVMLKEITKITPVIIL